MNRGPDYADDLTDSERRVLDQLLRRVGRDEPAGRTRRRGWLGAVLTAAAVAAIALAAGLVATNQPSAAPPPAPTIVQSGLSTEEALARLSTAARQSATKPPSMQVSVVVVNLAKSTTCANFAYRVTTQLKPSGEEGLPNVGVEVDRTTVPAAAGAWLSCRGGSGPATPLPDVKVFIGAAGSSPSDWLRLLGKMATEGPLVPDLVDPRTLPGGFSVTGLSADPDRLRVALEKATTAVQPGGSDAWWTTAGHLLSSFQCGSGVRAGVFDLAAESHLAGVQVVADPAVDLLGRPGVTLRVPYRVDGALTQADLTFDPATGVLLQRAVRAPSGRPWAAVLTAYGP